MALELGLVIVGELDERVAHLFIGKKAGEAAAALYLLDEIDRILFHGHRLRPATAPTLTLPTRVLRAEFPPVRSRNGPLKG